MDVEAKQIEKNYISSLHAKNVRLFDEVNAKFNGGFNFIVGPNGTGKTSLLRCISLSISNSNFEDSRFGDDSEFWVDYVLENSSYRVGLGAGSIKSNAYRRPTHLNNNQPSYEDGRSIIMPFQVPIVTPKFSPLFIGAYRKFNYMHINGMQRESPPSEQQNMYRNSSAGRLNGTDLPNLKQWMINRYFVIEKDWAIFEKSNWNYLLDQIGYIGPAGSDFSFVEIRQDLEPLFSLRGKKCYLEELSAGFQSVLSLILGIIEWIEGTNEGADKLINSATGTVIIDELDVHLHPEWQLTIRDTLERFFPSIQFIITTHSPHLIATAKTGEIIVLPEHEGVVNIEPTYKCYSGWSTDQILEDVMNVRSLSNKLYEQLIDEATDCFLEKNTEKLKEVISRLEEVVHPSNTIVSVFRTKLASLQLEA